MRKFLQLILSIFLGYLVSFYTIGEEKGYELFDISFDLNDLESLFEKDYSTENYLEEALHYYEKGLLYYKNNDYDSALDNFKEAYSWNPLHKETCYYLGMIYQSDEDYEYSLGYFTDAILVDSMYGESYFYRGLSHFYLEDYQKAINDFDSSVVYFPELAHIAKYNTALAYHNLEELDKAQEANNESLAFNSEYQYSRFNQIKLFFVLEKYKKALSLIPSYSAEFPDDYLPDFYAGLIYEQLGNISKALEAYDKSIALNANYFQTYYNKGILYFYQEDYEQALFNQGKSIELKYDDYESYLARGDVYLALENYNSAIADYDIALLYSANNAYAYFQKAVCCEKVGQNQLAIDNYKFYIEYEKEDEKNIKIANDKIAILK